MITQEEKQKRYEELLQYADKDYNDFLADWEHLCKNGSPALSNFMKKAQDAAVAEILNMKDQVKINGKPLAYYLEDCDCDFYENDKFYSTVFCCIWHVANQCVYKRASGFLKDGFHCQYSIDNAQFFPYITTAMLSCCLWHVLSGIPATVDITFEHIVTGENIMKTLSNIIEQQEFKDVKQLNYYYTVNYKRES